MIESIAESFPEISPRFSALGITPCGAILEWRDFVFRHSETIAGGNHGSVEFSAPLVNLERLHQLVLESFWCGIFPPPI